MISVSAVARGIAEADSVGTTANAQVATPISNNRFIWKLSLEPRYRGEQAMFREPMCSAFYRNNQKLRGNALPPPTPAAAPPAAPATSPSAAASKESHNEEQQYRTDGGVDDCTDHASTEMDA